MLGVQSPAKKTRRDRHCDLQSPLLCDAGRCKSNRNSAAAHSSGSGLCFITANTQSSHHSVPVHLQTCFCLPPSCHTTHKNEVRTKAHIRRAGGSTLSGVRNNSFWPSPACALKWSPWVAAYQRAAAIEWVVGITQPGFRTYTGHSKGRAHWASDADCAISHFDWDWAITIPPFFYGILQSIAFMQRLRWSLQSAKNINLYAMLQKLLLKYGSNNKYYHLWFIIGLWRNELTSNYCAGVNCWFPTFYSCLMPTPHWMYLYIWALSLYFIVSVFGARIGKPF